MTSELRDKGLVGLGLAAQPYANCTFALKMSGAAVGVVPVSHVFDPELVLDFEVFTMRFGDILGGQTLHVVAVHEVWHLRSVSFDVLVHAVSAYVGRTIQW